MHLPPYVEDAPGRSVVTAFVQPRAARTALAGVHGAAIKLKVTAPPVDDRANQAVEELVGGLLGMRRGRVAVVSGRGSRHKRVRVAGVRAEVVAETLQRSIGPVSASVHDAGIVSWVGSGCAIFPALMSRSRKSSSSKSTASKKTTRKKTAARTKSTRTTSEVGKTANRKSSKKTTAKKTTAKKTTAKKAASTRSRTAKPTAQKSAGRRTPKPAKFDKKALAQIRKTLEQERDELLRRDAELEQATFDATQSDMTGEVGLDEDFADAGTATFDRERDLSIRNNIRDLVDQITRAINRIENGTYGECERCGRPIDAARLKALPHALLCMDCKRREERAR
jgi:DnaK suppressor protein